MALVVPVGFASKYYRGPGAEWANDSLGGVFYVIFWCLAAAFVRPRWRLAAIATGALVATCAVEFLQLWHPPFLEAIRAHFIGATILGTTFVWSDFPYYFVGAAIG